MKSKKISLLLLLSLFTVANCTKKKDKTASNSGETSYEDQAVISGNIALTALLGETPSHVIALNTESGATETAIVEADGGFVLPVNREEPWFISFIDDSKTGADMIVSTFAADTLDTMTTTGDTETVDLGDVDVSGDKASAGVGASGVLDAIGMSEDAAATVGALDDASLRYSNPDIDGNGEVDAIEGKSYMIDFHNRFLAKKKDGSALNITDMKNAFYPDDMIFSYSGTGIMPQIPQDDFTAEPTTYEWSYSVAMPIATNGGQLCSGMNSGDTLAAGTACSLTKSDNTGANGNSVYVFGMEVSNLKAGDYTLKAGDKTYFWKNVAVSDFSAGDGFLALFLRMDVDANNKLTGVSYKWQKKGADGTYSLATEEEINLVVKDANDPKFGGYVSLKYQGNESSGSLGVMIEKKPQGSVVLADELENDSGAVNVQGSVLTEQMVKDGVDFNDFTTNPGISYDDKLGMRFFF